MVRKLPHYNLSLSYLAKEYNQKTESMSQGRWKLRKLFGDSNMTKSPTI